MLLITKSAVCLVSLFERDQQRVIARTTNGLIVRSLFPKAWPRYRSPDEPFPHHATMPPNLCGRDLAKQIWDIDYQLDADALAEIGRRLDEMKLVEFFASRPTVPHALEPRTVSPAENS